MKDAPQVDLEAAEGGFFSLSGIDPARIHREWQMTNTMWAAVQRMLAFLCLLALLPVFALLYVPVRWSARAPFLFKQKRPGFMGRPFKIHKITTMRAGSDKHSHFERGVALTDPAVTRIGRFLRDTKIDELPQLWNVVRGDMELVGPRPIAYGLDRLLSQRIKGFHNRYLVKPGLTNIGQVSVLDNAIGDEAIEDWRRRFEGEEHYIRNKSVSYDLILIALTLLFMVRKALRRFFRRARPAPPSTRLPGQGDALSQVARDPRADGAQAQVPSSPSR
jgi:putative colanic acid biosynthesis UDP-glucose lipid carrier transferase